MKSAILILVFPLAVFIAGCQENSLNQPDLPLEKKTYPVTRDIIKINRQIEDPVFGLCKLTGEVIYEQHFTNYSQSGSGLSEIMLRLEMQTELKDMFGVMHQNWNILGKSEDVVYVSEEGILLVEKTYPVSNRIDVALLVKYLVTTNGVGISSTQIVEIEN